MLSLPFRTLALALLLFAAVPTTAAPSSFQFPAGMVGQWHGIPSMNIMGPWSDGLTFNIAEYGNGNYLLSDTTNYDTPANGYQRFYVQGRGDGAGTLWYCGNLTHYGNTVMLAGYHFKDMFLASSVTSTKVDFCLSLIPGTYRDDPASAPWPLNVPSPCTGCGCGRWTFELLDKDTLLLTLLMAPPAVHLNVTLQRAGAAPDPPTPAPELGPEFACDFGPGGRDSKPVPDSPPAGANPGCPFSVRAPPPPRAAREQNDAAAEYDHCYVLNRKADYRLEWTLDNTTLRIRCSAKLLSPGQYLALGFRPLAYASVGNGKGHIPASLGTGINRVFGMQGADIVLGASSSASPDSAVQQYYAAEYVGMPQPDTSLEISNASASVSGERLELEFSRDVVGGWLAKHGLPFSLLQGASDILWAIGTLKSGVPTYHSVFRGIRDVDWRHPDIAMSPYRC